jgi:hypothetical protein
MQHTLWPRTRRVCLLGIENISSSRNTADNQVVNTDTEAFLPLRYHALDSGVEEI